MKIKLNELEWKKFEIVDDDFFTEVFVNDVMRNQLKPPCLIKLKDNKVISVGDINICFGNCDCNSNIDFEDIIEYCNLEIIEA